jgi:putative DNA primase/helicase
VAEHDRWYQWNGVRWELERRNGYYKTARDLCRHALFWDGARALNSSARRVLGRATTAANVVVNLRRTPEIGLLPEQLDADPWLLCTPEGTFDLRLGKLIESAREQYCTKTTLVPPKAGECPLWLGLIERIANGDESMRSYVARWCGYMLTGETREESLLFIHGPAQSGKSTFVRVLSEIMGDYARTSNMDSFTARDRPEHSTEIAKLAGARLVTASETDAGSRWNEQRIKVLTGRDRVAARFMRMDEFEFMPAFKLLIYGNHRPSLKTVDKAIQRRFHLLEFPPAIAEEDKDLHLDDKLRLEYPAILHWCIQGCLQWQDCGLGKPERVMVDTDSYLQAMDVMGAWIDECLELQQGFKTQVSELYKSYCVFVRERGEYEPSMRRFSEDLGARNIVQKQKTASFMVFVGCRLREQSAPHYSKFED